MDGPQWKIVQVQVLKIANFISPQFIQHCLIIAVRVPGVTIVQIIDGGGWLGSSCPENSIFGVKLAINDYLCQGAIWKG